MQIASTSSLHGSAERRAVLKHVELAGGSQPTALVNEPGTLIYLVPTLLSELQHTSLFSSLAASDFFIRAVDDFGPQDRLTSYFGESGAIFSYVGVVCKPQPWPACVAEALLRVNDVIAAAHGTKCTGCLLNNYEAGMGQIPWHSDEVRAHGAAKLVIALSTGGERPFYLRRRAATTQDGVVQVLLPPGSALVMAGEAQSHWEHALPLEPAADGGPAPHRISLTFRSIELGFEEGREPPHAEDL